MALITMLSSAERKIIENEGKWKVCVLLASRCIGLCVYVGFCFFFLMDNSFSFLSLLVYSQGSDKVRDIPCPEELVFTVDQKIINEIERTKEMYYEKVGFLAAYPDCH